MPSTWGNRLHGGLGLPCLQQGALGQSGTRARDQVLLGDTTVRLSGGARVGTRDQGGGKPVKWVGSRLPRRGAPGGESLQAV